MPPGRDQQKIQHLFTRNKVNYNNVRLEYIKIVKANLVDNPAQAAPSPGHPSRSNSCEDEAIGSEHSLNLQAESVTSHITNVCHGEPSGSEEIDKFIVKNDAIPNSIERSDNLHGDLLKKLISEARNDLTRL